MERNDVSLRSVAQWDSIGSVHKMIFNNQSAAQRDRTVLKNLFYIGLQPSGTVPMIRYPMHRKHRLNSLKRKMKRKL